MKRPFHILIILISILFSNCARKPVYTCGLDYLANRPIIDSRIIELKRTGIADTTIAYISGRILGKDSTDAEVSIDTLAYANVYIVNKTTGQTIGKVTDLNGKFEFSLPSASYDLKVKYIAYNTLIVRNVFLGTGDIFEFNALLGQSGVSIDSTEYRMTKERMLEKIK